MFFNRNALQLVYFINAPCVNPTESIVEPNQQKQNWYHQRFRRVPTIDQCYTDDAVCRFEADQQFRRDRMVDNEIVNILRQRFEDCTLYEAPDHMVKCRPLMDQYEKATENWFIKCEWNPLPIFFKVVCDI